MSCEVGFQEVIDKVVYAIGVFVVLIYSLKFTAWSLIWCKKKGKELSVEMLNWVKKLMET